MKQFDEKTKTQCEDCGLKLVEDQNGVLYCPRCESDEEGDEFDEEDDEDGLF
jgi:uncharacterized Zn finger protein (UPF0148 family)